MRFIDDKVHSMSASTTFQTKYAIKEHSNMRLKRLKDRRKQSFIEGIDPTLMDSEVDKIERAERIEYCDPRFHSLNYGRRKRPKSSTVTSPR